MSTHTTLAPLAKSPVPPGATGLDEMSAQEFKDQLAASGVLVPTGVTGLYARGQAFEDIATGVMGVVEAWGEHQGAQQLHFPPVLSRHTFEQTNYVESFPDLMGSVHVFDGGDREHAGLVQRLADGGDWADQLEASELMLSSAACHPVYPLCTGQVPQQGRRFVVVGHCFRHEPSPDPARMQSFRMQEVVFVGDPQGAMAHRDEGLAFGIDLLGRLGLEASAVPATDPFFGRAGKVLAAGQREQNLKIEGVVPILSRTHPTAVMSANCHQDHFSLPFAIATPDGHRAHSACVAFGIERITLALLRTHGTNPATWGSQVRNVLAL